MNGPLVEDAREHGQYRISISKAAGKFEDENVG